MGRYRLTKTDDKAKMMTLVKVFCPVCPKTVSFHVPTIVNFTEDEINIATELAERVIDIHVETNHRGSEYALVAREWNSDIIKCSR